jgi:hypothetical protein
MKDMRNSNKTLRFTNNKKRDDTRTKIIKLKHGFTR